MSNVHNQSLQSIKLYFYCLYLVLIGPCVSLATTFTGGYVFKTASAPLRQSTTTDANKQPLLLVERIWKITMFHFVFRIWITVVFSFWIYCYFNLEFRGVKVRVVQSDKKVFFSTKSSLHNVSSDDASILSLTFSSVITSPVFVRYLKLYLQVF